MLRVGSVAIRNSSPAKPQYAVVGATRSTSCLGHFACKILIATEPKSLRRNPVRSGLIFGNTLIEWTIRKRQEKNSMRKRRRQFDATSVDANCEKPTVCSRLFTNIIRSRIDNQPVPGQKRKSVASLPRMLWLPINTSAVIVIRCLVSGSLHCFDDPQEGNHPRVVHADRSFGEHPRATNLVGLVAKR
jgi:hypothetical protein